MRRHVALLAATALVATGIATGATLSASATLPLPASSIPGLPAFAADRYIVTLAGDAAATYQGGVSGLTATAPALGDQLDAADTAVQAYTAHLTALQLAVATAVGATPDYHYTYALNGFAANLTGAQATALAATPGVVGLEADSIQQVQAEPSTDFLGLSGAGGVWESVGGVETAGEGIVIGVLDTGIAPENPSFAGDALGNLPGDAPFYSSLLGNTSYAKADGGTFAGACETGVGFELADCSTKVIGARFFAVGFGVGAGTPADGEFLSPRDGNGHGSHTASTAAGNIEVAANVAGRDFGTITGIAPAAKIAAYKVCWTGVAMSGCFSTDLVAAIDKSVEDGVDVLNYSIGGGAATTTVSATGEAFLGAASAGIFVSASAGNSGPGSSTLDNAAPWLMTVGASTIPSYEASVRLGNGAEFAGASIGVDPEAPLSGDFVTATDVALPGTATPSLCEAGELDPALAVGKIVACERGINDRVAKSAEVLRAGGIGMVLVNPTPSSIDLDEHSVPSVHLDAVFFDDVWSYAGSAGATVELIDGNITDATPATPQMAGFSSRGPVLADGSDLLKPDIAAPGVAILAAGANGVDEDGTWRFLSGTSMSAPHIAGLGVLYLGAVPNASPSEVKSAMMTTAYNTLDASGDTVTDPFSQGAGHVDPTRFFTPGFLYLSGIDDWNSYKAGTGNTAPAGTTPIDASNLNLPSLAIGSLAGSETLTRTVTSTQAGTFVPTVTEMDGITVTVSPQVLAFGAAGETQQYTVTFERGTAPLDTWVTGSLDWTGVAPEGTSDPDFVPVLVHSPMAVQPVAGPAAETSASPWILGVVSTLISRLI
ncbi:MAG: S8 family serine peptidase [Burkholderiaceae bacterium]|nr:S8 family serine peptidase [Microbacteriaceae bacterium]